MANFGSPSMPLFILISRSQAFLDLSKSQQIRLNATVTGDCGDVNSLNE